MEFDHLICKKIHSHNFCTFFNFKWHSFITKESKSNFIRKNNIILIETRYMAQNENYLLCEHKFNFWMKYIGSNT